MAQFVQGTNRVWFSAQAAQMPRNTETLECLSAEARDSRGMCMVVSDPAGEESAERQKLGPANRPQLNPAAPIAVQWVRYNNRELAFDVTCPDEGWLLVTDRWAPSWRVMVNDRPGKVWIGDLVFRAVEVSQGENRIRFRTNRRPSAGSFPAVGCSCPWRGSAPLSLPTANGLDDARLFQLKRRRVAQIEEHRQQDRGPEVNEQAMADVFTCQARSFGVAR